MWTLSSSLFDVAYMVEDGESVTTFELVFDSNGSWKRASLPDAEIVRRVERSTGERAAWRAAASRGIFATIAPCLEGGSGMRHTLITRSMSATEIKREVCVESHCRHVTAEVWPVNEIPPMSFTGSEMVEVETGREKRRIEWLATRSSVSTSPFWPGRGARAE